MLRRYINNHSIITIIVNYDGKSDWLGDVIASIDRDCMNIYFVQYCETGFMHRSYFTSFNSLKSPVEYSVFSASNDEHQI